MQVKIKELFDAYEAQIANTPNIESIFSEAGMVNRYAELIFGFHPLGSGILTDKCKIEDAEIAKGETMVLGHDFGTVSYVEVDCPGKRERNSSKTIFNLMSLGLDLEKTFFTNYYMGLRDDVNHPDFTMTKLATPRTKAYTEFCNRYFLSQLRILDPKVVICLGKEVRLILSIISSNFFDAKSSIMSLFKNQDSGKYEIYTDNKTLGKRKFVLIPHPSFAHINWAKENIKAKIEAAIQ